MSDTKFLLWLNKKCKGWVDKSTPEKPATSFFRKRLGKYILIKQVNHHFSRHGFIFEHRYVWEKFNKAILLPWGVVHHKNEIKTDNRPENLEAMMNYQHFILHIKKRHLKKQYG
jgi:hypothetical protein